MRRRLLPENLSKKVVFDISNFIMTSVFLLIALEPADDLINEQRDVLIDVLRLMVAGMLISLQIHHWNQDRKDFDFHIQSISKELSKTKSFINTTIDTFYKQKHNAKLACVSTNDKSSFQLTTQIALKDERTIELMWEVGTGALLQQAKDLQTIFSELNMNIPAPLCLQTIPKLKPYIAYCQDFPSKFRVFNLLTMVGGGASYTLKSLYQLNLRDFFLLYLTLSSMLFVASVAESYILNDNKMRLSLEGFRNVYRSDIDFPQTCIGRQLTEKLLCYPDSKYLRDLVKYFITAKKILSNFKQTTNSVNLSDKARRNIENFFSLFEDEKHLTETNNNLIKLSFVREMSNKNTTKIDIPSVNDDANHLRSMKKDI